MGYLVLDAILYGILAFYLENVLPKEYGVRRTPCFCVKDALACCSGPRRKVGSGGGDGDDTDIELDLLAKKTKGAPAKAPSRAEVEQKEEEELAAAEAGGSHGRVQSNSLVDLAVHMKDGEEEGGQGRAATSL